MKIIFEPFSVEYEPILSPVLDFKTESVHTLRRILLSASNKNIAVMMSGGLDSELVARCMHNAGIPFTAVIGRFMTRLTHDAIIFNKHDYAYAEKWCGDNNIKIVYCDIDVFKEADTLITFALDAQSLSPQFACHMYMMKWCNDHGYFFITGNAEMDFVLNGDNEYYLLDEQRESALMNFYNIYQLHGSFQFCKDSRLISAFIHLPTVQLLMSKKVTRLLDYKADCFNDVFNMEVRPKFTGFEKIQQWDSIFRTYLSSRTGQFDEKFYTPLSYFNFNGT